MKKTIIFLALLLVASYAFSQDQIFISFSKNSSGELIMTIEGHASPIVVSAGNNKITLQVIENKINLTALGINDLTEIVVDQTSAKEENVEDVETAAGTTAAAADNQPVIPPINPSINPNPPLSTPY